MAVARRLTASYPRSWSPRLVPTFPVEVIENHPLGKAGGLIGLYIPGGAAGGTDFANNGTPLVLQRGGVLGAGQIGPAAVLDGSPVGGTFGNFPTYVQGIVNSAPAWNFTTGNFSISMLVAVASLASTKALFLKGKYQSNGYYATVATNGHFDFTTNQPGAAQQPVSSNGVVAVNQLYELTFVRNGTAVTLWANGANVTATAPTIVSPADSSTNSDGYPANSLLLGNYPTNGPPAGYDLTGSVFTLRGWNRALSATEVAQLAAEPFGMLRPKVRRTYGFPSTAPSRYTAADMMIGA